MSEENKAPIGQRFSHLYLADDSLSKDSARMRRRMGSCFDLFFDGKDVTLGKYLEQELGIQVVKQNYGRTYVLWTDFCSGAELRDVLDAITLSLKIGDDIIGTHANGLLRIKLDRILAEEMVGYALDDSGGVHPKLDGAFDAVRATLVDGLSRKIFQAAHEHLKSVDSAMLADPMDGRMAIRGVFDVVENIFKQAFPGVTHVNSSAIANSLRPKIEVLYESSIQEKRTALKLADGFKTWVDTAHFYRHAAGQPEPEQPSEETAIHMVFQGFSIARWLLEILHKDKRSKP